MSTIVRPASLAFLSLASLASLSACGSGSSGSGGPELTGQASLSITSVPASVQCVQITVAGSSTVTQNFSVMPGQSSVGLALGSLPLGAAAVTGSAFDATCDGLAGQQATWVADAQTVQLKAGEITTLTLNFREVLPSSGTANFIGTATAIALSRSSTFLLLADGSTHFSGFIPDAYFDTLHSLGYPAATLLASDGVADVCELGTDSTTRCLGHQFFGVGTIALPSPPSQIVMGSGHACALVPSPNEIRRSSIYCWGANFDGQLGNGTTTPVGADASGTTAPVQASYDFLSQVSAGGATTCAVTGSGGVTCWGNNANGQIGDGTTTNRLSPTGVVGVEAITQVSVGDTHTCALRADGAVFCWGLNAHGELGDGTTIQKNTPVQVLGIANAVQVVAQETSTCALLASGTVSCWGNNADGELGNGTGLQSTTPVTVKGLHGIKWLPAAAEANHMCASDAQNVWCWGYNIQGQLADGTYDDAFEPVPMSSL